MWQKLRQTELSGIEFLIKMVITTGIVLFGIMGLSLVGLWVDKLFITLPLFTIIGVLVGTFLSLFGVVWIVGIKPGLHHQTHIPNQEMK